jgi:hypothetical protein
VRSYHEQKSLLWQCLDLAEFDAVSLSETIKGVRTEWHLNLVKFRRGRVID